MHKKIKLPIEYNEIGSSQGDKMEKTNDKRDRQTLYKDAADSDCTVGIAFCPSDRKTSKASKVICHPQSAIASLLVLGTELAQPAAATFPFTQGQYWL